MPERLPPRQRTIPALLELQAQRHAERVLARGESRSLAYADALDRTPRTAGGLVAAGIGAGDRVAVLSENRLEMVELWLACAWLGAVLVPINTALRGGQLGHVLRDSGAKLLVPEPDLAPVL